MLTLAQRIYLVKCYGIGNVSYKYTISVFNKKYPVVHVSIPALINLLKKFNATGDVKDEKRKLKKYDEDDAATLVVLDSVHQNRKHLLENGLYKAFKPTILHTLEDGGDARRLEFCLVLSEKILKKPLFCKYLIFSDESIVTTNGVVCSQNNRMWATENPHAKIYSRSLRYKKVNVWCGVCYDMLDNFLLLSFDDVPLQIRNRIIYPQDGFPGHSTVTVQDLLNKKFSR
ncbi:hypothetical protein ILUMI_14954 [Ignelater luminosus]|uniref:Uncharacterized protein n=1 Tax=Ignelater luminosus TaxID=2038154 RepID=A0A8K0CPI2_IGNLU|nr:hypothetical protein ILUMI_14954 [Ignelater luminosus]